MIDMSKDLHRLEGRDVTIETAEGTIKGTVVSISSWVDGNVTVAVLTSTDPTVEIVAVDSRDMLSICKN